MVRNRWLFLFLVVIALALVAGAASAQMTVPENFFTAYVIPDNRITFGSHYPDLHDPKEAQNPDLWASIAKLRLLLENSQAFQDAYTATSNDPELQQAGVTFTDWSVGSSEQKQAAQAKLQRHTNSVVAKHNLLTIFRELRVDDRLLEAKISEIRGSTPGELPLVRFCPGSANHVAVNAADKGFPRFQKISKSPQYQAAVKAFNVYLGENPTATIDERNRKLNDLVAPLMNETTDPANGHNKK